MKNIIFILLILSLSACGGGSSSSGGPDVYRGTINYNIIDNNEFGGPSESVSDPITISVDGDNVSVDDGDGNPATGKLLSSGKFIASASTSDNECTLNIELIGTIDGNQITGTVLGDAACTNNRTFMVLGNFSASK